MRIYGINPVIEALRAGRVVSLSIADHARSRLREIVKLAAERGTPVQHVTADALGHASGGGPHQGVVAELAELRQYTVRQLVETASAVPLLVVLDGVDDPRNVGAIVRTVDAAGADGIIQQTRRAARLGGAAAKASAGALAHVKVASVVNIARALDEVKEAGIWTVGLAGDATHRYDDVDLTLPTAFVVGAEQKGLRRLVRERCDWVVAIPMAGHVASLNVSVAAGIALFETVRQRTRRNADLDRPIPGKGAWR